MSFQCIVQCANVVPQTRNDEQQTKQGKLKEHTGTGKVRGQSGHTKGGKTWTHTGGEGKGKETGRDQPTPPPRTDTRRAERRGGSKQPLDQEDRAGEKGYLTGYTPTPEDLRLQEVYGDWVHANPDTHLHGGIRDNET